jgi:hypothetical protein
MKNAGNNLPILCNQENFLLKANLFKIKQCLPNSHIFFKPASKQGITGRPKNGMFIAIPKAIKNRTTDVSPASSRVQAIIIERENKKLLVINSYFPQDSQNSEVSLSDLSTTLLSIRETINNNNFDDLIWTGYINADFRRSTIFTELVNEFTRELNIHKSWDKFFIDFTHANDMNGTTYTSVIDHFFWSEATDSSVVEADVLHLPNNLSDHCPIYCKLSLEINEPVKGVCQYQGKTKPCWNKATIEERLNYNYDLEEKLKTMIIPSCIVNCRDVHCHDESHRVACDEFMLEILRSIEKSANKQLPLKNSKVGNISKNAIPRWNEDIKPFKENAHFWHAIWQSAGRPLNCQLHSLMKKTRNLYHLHIRKNKRMLDNIKRNNLLNCCLNGKGNIFDEVKKSRRCQQTFAPSIDNITENIPMHFAKIYKNLYNSVEDQDDLRIVEEKIKTNINTMSLQHIDLITKEVLTNASSKLKPGKSDPILDISSDCLLNAPSTLFERLSLIMRSYLIHGHISDFLLISSLLPIIKDKLGDTSVSSNYRSIAISSLVMKLFDWVIILLYGDRLKLHDLQFSYQANVSTSMCTWMVVETIEYFLRNKSEIFACTMDMSKAFDRVKHSTLFDKLRKEDLPPIIIRFLMSVYKLQIANVKWNGEISNSFKIGNGVKQGAVLSAILYCVYMNDLFILLKKKKFGCWINGEYYGIIGYADDLFLLSPSKCALQKMLQSCESYAKEHNLVFSTDINPNKSKTKCIAFLNEERELNKLMLCDNILPWVNNVKHLGITLENKSGCILKQDIRIKRAQYIQRNNEIMQEFHFAHPSTKIKLNNIYNTHFTGSVIWDLFSRETVMVENTWNVSIRKMCNLHRKTHRYIIEPISEVTHIKFSLLKRFLKFTYALAGSSKHPVQALFNILKRDCSSTTGSNLRRIMRLVGKDDINEIQIKDLSPLQFCPVKKEDEWRVNIVRELLEAKSKQVNINNMDNDDISSILDYICTS